jgi:hypothetical protein
MPVARINAPAATPSCGKFLTCMGKKQSGIVLNMYIYIGTIYNDCRLLELVT